MVKISPDGKLSLGKESIQGTIEKAIKEITGEDVELTSSGRTDAGVHALGQVANFKTNSNILINKFPYAINSKLPNSIVIKEASYVDDRFHSRYNCKGKTYRYIINNNEFPSALNRYREFHIPQILDFEAMKEAIKFFEGTHDFAGFKSSGGSPKKTTVRTIKKAAILKDKNNIITIELTGDGFLYNMVRIICGTLVDVGLRKDQRKRYSENNPKQRPKNGWKNTPTSWIISSQSKLLKKMPINDWHL